MAYFCGFLHYDCELFNGVSQGFRIPTCTPTCTHLKDASQIPPIAEIFFTELKAEVQFTPVMNKEDLQSGLQASAHLHHAAV